MGQTSSCVSGQQAHTYLPVSSTVSAFFRQHPYEPLPLVARPTRVIRCCCCYC
jgi:hypothetical protein